jgi:hypothetical protein
LQSLHAPKPLHGPLSPSKWLMGILCPIVEPRADACERLSATHRMIARFSRALAEDLRQSMSDAAFEATLTKSIDEIHRTSTVKA